MALRDYLSTNYPDHAIALIYGCRDQRPWERFVAPLHGLFDHVWTTYPPFPQRCGTEPAVIAAGNWGAPTSPTDTYPEAIFQAWQWACAQTRPVLVVVAGQIRLVGACRAYLNVEG